MTTNLQAPGRLFYVGLIVIVIGYVFLRTPPVDGPLSLTLAPLLLLAGYIVLAPLGLRPRYRRPQPDEPRDLQFRQPLTAVVGGAAVFLITLLFYWITLWPGPGWWDSSAYITASYTLGVYGPPGSMLLQLLGRFFGFLIWIDSPAVRINLMTAVATAAAVTVVFFTILRLVRMLPTTRRSNAVSVMAAAVGALTIAFAYTIWQHATFTNPYALSLLTGVLLLYTGVRWWEAADRKGGDNYLLLAALLFGLDFSVHRSNFLLTPAFLALVLIRKPRVLLDFRIWLGSIVLFAIGLSLQFTNMFRAQLSPETNIGNPDTLQGLWDYLSLKQQGIAVFGSDLLQRKGEFWSYQVNHMFVRYLGWNTVGISLDGSSVAWRFPFGLPALFALGGLVTVWIKRWKLALWLTITLLCATGLAIFYLNIPANYFREMDRHFIVSFAMAGLFVGLGTFVLLDYVRRWWRRRPVRGPIAIGAVLLLLLPMGQLLGGWARNDQSDNYAPVTYARNFLIACDPDAVLVTGGDNDTFPLWYLQRIENVRPDIAVLNYSLLNTVWYFRTVRQYHPDLPFTLTDSAVAELVPHEPERYEISLPLSADSDDSLTFALVLAGRTYVLVADQILLDLLTTNRFERPVYFSTGIGKFLPLGIERVARLDGMVSKVVPDNSERRSTEILYRNLMDRFTYDGFTTKETIDPTTRWVIGSYFQQFWMMTNHLRETDQRQMLDDLLVRYREVWPDGPELIQPEDSTGDEQTDEEV
ncbi:DUF2723 domain-containing protein [bacterium]|nr:DUF2723 domain-containing protein [bacterium]